MGFKKGGHKGDKPFSTSIISQHIESQAQCDIIFMKVGKTMDGFNVKIKEFKNAKKGDILAFDGKQWVPATLEQVVGILTDKIKELDAKVEQIGVNTYAKITLFEKTLDEQRQQIAEVLKGLVK